MTASAGTTTPAAAPATEPRVRFRDLLAAEWLKLWSLRSTPWNLLTSGLAVIALNVDAAYDHYRYWHEQHMSPAEFIAQGLPLLDAPQPYPAWLCLVTAPYPPVGTRLPWTVAGAWTVFAVWAVLALVIAAAAVDRRDQ